MDTYNDSRANSGLSYQLLRSTAPWVEAPTKRSVLLLKTPD